MVEPYFKAGRSVGTMRPWEPFLTNKMLVHADHRGTVAGEWILVNKGWTVVDPVYFDVMTIFDVTNTTDTSSGSRPRITMSPRLRSHPPSY